VPASLDRDRIQGIVHEIGEQLAGDWLLIGGGLVALWLEPDRTTEDLDLVGIRGAGHTTRVCAALDQLPETGDAALRARRARLRALVTGG